MQMQHVFFYFITTPNKTENISTIYPSMTVNCAALDLCADKTHLHTPHGPEMELMQYLSDQNTCISLLTLHITLVL